MMFCFRRVSKIGRGSLKSLKRTTGGGMFSPTRKKKKKNQEEKAIPFLLLLLSSLPMQLLFCFILLCSPLCFSFPSYRYIRFRFHSLLFLLVPFRFFSITLLPLFDLVLLLIYPFFFPFLFPSHSSATSSLSWFFIPLVHSTLRSFLTFYDDVELLSHKVAIFL